MSGRLRRRYPSVVRVARVIHQRVRAFGPAYSRRRPPRHQIPPGLLLTVVGQQQPESGAMGSVARLDGSSPWLSRQRR
jgi:hypothetical protein